MPPDLQEKALCAFHNVTLLQHVCLSLSHCPQGTGEHRGLEAQAQSKACVSPSDAGSNLGILAQGGCSALYAGDVGQSVSGNGHASS